MSGARFATATIASFHFTQPDISLCGCPHRYRTEVALDGMGSHQRGERPKRDAPRSETAVSLRMAEALTEFAL
jgi:hypothetical protein